MTWGAADMSAYDGTEPSRAALEQRRCRARKRGEDVPYLKPAGKPRPRVSDDDPRRERAIAMRAAGRSTREIRRALGLGATTMLRWLADTTKGERVQVAATPPASVSDDVPVLTPAPYAYQFGMRLRWFNTKW